MEIDKLKIILESLLFVSEAPLTVKRATALVKDATAEEIQQAFAVLLEEINSVVPGIGAPSSIVIQPGSPAAGKTLAELNLRSLTGASVIALTRGGDRHLMPAGKELVQAGDTLVLVGTQEAVGMAKDLLRVAH